MIDLSRELVVRADDEPVTGFVHARLTGIDTVGLYPMPFTLKLWNLPDSEYYRITAAKEIFVFHNDSVLASGTISDICRDSVPEGHEREDREPETPGEKRTCVREKRSSCATCRRSFKN